MINYLTKNYYKGRSLFIKTSILIISTAYIINKINSSTVWMYFYETQLQWRFCWFALLLMFINWGIEAYKWQLLIKRTQKLSFFKSFQSIFSGVTIGIFTPNRIGEFAGRVFYLDTENKIQATIISFFGSFFQLTVTLFVGMIAAICIAIDDVRVKQILLEVFKSNYFLIVVVVFLLFIMVIFISKKWIKHAYKQQLAIIHTYSFIELTNVFFLSIFRYCIFTIQYYFILQCFNIDLNFFLSIQLIALTFFVSTIVPSFAFSEIAVRGASAIYFFSLYVPDVSLVLASSLALWLINLALPSFIGAFFIWKLKFFKE